MAWDPEHENDGLPPALLAAFREAVKVTPFAETFVIQNVLMRALHGAIRDKDWAHCRVLIHGSSSSSVGKTSTDNISSSQPDGELLTVDLLRAEERSEFCLKLISKVLQSLASRPITQEDRSEVVVSVMNDLGVFCVGFENLSVGDDVKEGMRILMRVSGTRVDGEIPADE